MATTALGTAGHFLMTDVCGMAQITMIARIMMIFLVRHCDLSINLRYLISSDLHYKYVHEVYTGFPNSFDIQIQI